jgi:hypothetical protein
VTEDYSFPSPSTFTTEQSWEAVNVSTLESKTIFGTENYSSPSPPTITAEETWEDVNQSTSASTAILGTEETFKLTTLTEELSTISSPSTFATEETREAVNESAIFGTEETFKLTTLTEESSTISSPSTFATEETWGVSESTSESTAIFGTEKTFKLTTLTEELSTISSPSPPTFATEGTWEAVNESTSESTAIFGTEETFNLTTLTEELSTISGTGVNFTESSISYAETVTEHPEGRGIFPWNLTVIIASSAFVVLLMTIAIYFAYKKRQ